MTEATYIVIDAEWLSEYFTGCLIGGVIALIILWIIIFMLM